MTQSSSITHSTTEVDERFMRLALAQAKLAAAQDEVPIGAVLVKDDTLISSGFNRTITDKDATSHAEIEAIRAASKILNNHRINGAVLYVTMEPCLMCFGAIVQARISRLVYAAKDNRFAVAYPLTQLQTKLQTNHWPIIEAGVLAEESSQLISEFFRDKRAHKK